tara:strand:+ start:150 stop:347 length:198 start_codon:yes stop_codon:yes gene_type:complete
MDKELRKGLGQAGKAMSIPMLMVSGPLAGYFLGTYVFASVEIACVLAVVGFLASVRCVLSIIRKL